MLFRSRQDQTKVEQLRGSLPGVLEAGEHFGGVGRLVGFGDGVAAAFRPRGIWTWKKLGARATLRCGHHTSGTPCAFSQGSLSSEPQLTWGSLYLGATDAASNKVVVS